MSEHFASVESAKIVLYKYSYFPFLFENIREGTGAECIYEVQPWSQLLRYFWQVGRQQAWTFGVEKTGRIYNSSAKYEAFWLRWTKFSLVYPKSRTLITITSVHTTNLIWVAFPITINEILVLVCPFRHFHNCIEFPLASKQQPNSNLTTSPQQQTKTALKQSSPVLNWWKTVYLWAHHWEKCMKYRQLLTNLFTSGIFDRQLLKLPAIATSSPAPVHLNTAGYLWIGFTSIDRLTLPSSSQCCNIFTIKYIQNCILLLTHRHTQFF